MSASKIPEVDGSGGKMWGLRELQEKWRPGEEERVRTWRGLKLVVSQFGPEGSQ